MSGMKINKDNLKRHGYLFEDALTGVADDLVELDSRVDFPAYSNLKNALSYSSDMRSETSEGTTHEIGNIYYLVSVMEGVDNGAVSEAKALNEE